MQEELEREVGRERSVHLADKARLPYTEAVLLETQRLASIAPSSLPHMTLSDTELCGYYIPKGTMVSAYATLCTSISEFKTCCYVDQVN